MPTGTSGSEPVRLFAAVWPPEEVLDHLDLALAAVRGATAGEDRGPVRWAARETWHLTLAFYGTVADGSAPILLEELAAAAAAAEPYALRLRGAGVFSHRTLWTGVAGDLDQHRALTHACGRAGDEVGAPPDVRVRERPHLTVGRVRPGAPAVRGGRAAGRRRAERAAGDVGGQLPEDLVSALAVYEGPTWTVTSLRLVESTPGAGRGGGPLYVPVGELPLGT
ncbi:RNA 2',3'-cyclic phosphodiesterase [Cellulomonas sp. T2.31MG-18]|uniref:RNA 2',3'-cyclic phosphodiesterase n=1 Tax=Cellulomonas sp. T2.31MG-18 TaxID=3157619 RepID=UPI0035EF0938